MAISIYTDGACCPNPGYGGWGLVIYGCADNPVELKGGSPNTTNNRMEMKAVYEAIRWVKSTQPAGPVTIYSDSRYVVNGMTVWRASWVRKKYRKVKNPEQWQAMHRVAEGLAVKYQWVKGHAGIVGNERADKLAEEGRADVFAPIAAEAMLLADNPWLTEIARADVAPAEKAPPEKVEAPKRQSRAEKEERAAALLVRALDAASEFGFVAQQLSTAPTHCRFTRDRVRVDFWPATGRYWLVGTPGKASIGDIAEVFAQIVTPDADPTHPNPLQTQQPAHKN